MPQWSVLGPVLFNVGLYIASLRLLLRQENTNCSMYADDTDLYLNFKPSELTENVSEMERTLVSRWMAVNELKLNSAKTEVMPALPRAQPAVCVIHMIDHGRQQRFQHRRHNALECTASVSARDIADIATFKIHSQTHLFVQHYGP